MDSKTQSTQITEVKVINYERILSRHKAELLNLAKACSPPPNGLGFFFLDLNCPSVSYAVEDLVELNDSTRDYFLEAGNVKLKDGVSKHTGKQRYSRSTIEALELPTKELAKSNISQALPEALQPAAHSISRLLAILEHVAQDIFACLCLTIDPTGKLKNVSTVRGENLDHESVLRLCFEEPTNRKTFKKDQLQAGDNIGGAEHTMGILRIMQYDEARFRWLLNRVAGAETWSSPLPAVEGCLLVNIGDGMQALTGGRYHAPEYMYIKVNDDEEGVCSFEYILRQEAWGAPHFTEEQAAGVIPSQVEELQMELARLKKKKKRLEEENSRIERDLQACDLGFRNLKAKYRHQRQTLRRSGGYASNSTDDAHGE
ncbi:hypothetical protein E2P81_ATG06811 [Venturia nashicola]|uniref:Uncharacterized protein n=1 Tax=Venturia nashicola TaxID=86259 RepID=A0A4Z1NUT8_9PEZI|nr:hypothetical protein E6O75_ATG06982 [Venturia nashicola]TLD30158.1 hypothetical protein E2P81_ATG06811 [Venturia nashicola]